MSRRIAETHPLPASFQKPEIGLMTREEFLEHRNPERKHHGSDSYDFSLKQMNRDFNIRRISFIHRRDGQIDVYKTDDGFFFKTENDVIAVVHDGTIYHDKHLRAKDIPKGVQDYNRYTPEYHDIPFDKERVVKYPGDYIYLVSDVAKKNRRVYTNLFSTSGCWGTTTRCGRKGHWSRTKGSL